MHIEGDCASRPVRFVFEAAAGTPLCQMDRHSRRWWQSCTLSEMSFDLANPKASQAVCRHSRQADV